MNFRNVVRRLIVAVSLLFLPLVFAINHALKVHLCNGVERILEVFEVVEHQAKRVINGIVRSLIVLPPNKNVVRDRSGCGADLIDVLGGNENTQAIMSVVAQHVDDNSALPGDLAQHIIENKKSTSRLVTIGYAIFFEFLQVAL